MHAFSTPSGFDSQVDEPSSLGACFGAGWLMEFCAGMPTVNFGVLLHGRLWVSRVIACRLVTFR